MSELARGVAEGLAFLHAQPGVREAEVFAAANRMLIARLNYTSDIPCNGVEEPKSSEGFGVGIQVALDGPDGPLLAFGAEPGDLSLTGVERAWAKARRAAVHDPEFVSLPRPGREARALQAYHDPALLDLADDRLVAVGWQVLDGALRAFLASGRLADLAPAEGALRKLGLIVGGDVTIIQEQVAIASTHMPEPQSDVTTLITAGITAMVEARQAKGSGWSTGVRLDDFTDEAGAEAAQQALAAIDGERVPTGTYAVVFGPQPVTDLLNNLLLPACHASNFYSSSTPFLGKLGRPVVSPELSIHDDGALPGLMGSKGITCEGLPTGRTDLIRQGVLTGLLANWYEAERLLRDPAAREKLGVPPAEAASALIARNGFRFAGMGRSFDTQPGIAASNVIVEGRRPLALPDLLRTVRDGLYVGRIWYTYPINGLRAGDFTCTVIGDSFIIRDGALVGPLRANTIRINDNILRMLGHVIGVGKDAKGTVVWAADEVVYAPAIACAGVRVDAIAGSMEGMG